jgi:hypothetical protein
MKTLKNIISIAHHSIFHNGSSQLSWHPDFDLLAQLQEIASSGAAIANLLYYFDYPIFSCNEQRSSLFDGCGPTA